MICCVGNLRLRVCGEQNLVCAGSPLGSHTLLPAALPTLQDELEAGLLFCGLAVMVNPLRGDTTAIIAQLQVCRAALLTCGAAAAAGAQLHTC